MTRDYLAHHGILGMKWGVRRFQRRDGTRTSAGKRRRNATENIKTVKAQYDRVSEHVDSGLTTTKRLSEKVYDFKQKVNVGKKETDRILEKGTEFSRIQLEPSYVEGRAFYAVYKEQDANLYAGLYGSQLKKGLGRSTYKSDKNDVYQVKIAADKDIKVPSDKQAADIAANMLSKDKEFKNELQQTFEGAGDKFRRYTQKELFSEASETIKKDPSEWSDKEKSRLYEALNLSFTEHGTHELAVQEKFYGELKKQGYGALTDINDKKYSTYHAKDPVIVFDTDSVRLHSVTKLDPEEIDKLYEQENPKRVRRDAISVTSQLIDRFATNSIDDIKRAGISAVKEYTRR